MFSKSVNVAMKECTADLLRVSMARTPVDSTTLEKSGTSKVECGLNSTTGIVSFKAMNKGYNYAYKMDKGTYKLGKKSLDKSSRGVRSKFCNSALKVGTGYLTDTADKCQKGYAQHISKAINSTIISKGFSK